MRLSPLLIAAFGLASCGQSQPSEPREEIMVRSPEQDQLHKLTPMNRDIAMKRAILGAGLRCKRVTGSGYVTEYKNLSMWAAKCDDGREWAVYVGPDGTAQVRNCQDVARFGLPPCVMKKDGSQAG